MLQLDIICFTSKLYHPPSVLARGVFLYSKVAISQQKG
nr:MAG TPA: hypothetical protein [Caudoviricetes sp.]